jgi:hypothetical protein
VAAVDTIAAGERRRTVGTPQKAGARSQIHNAASPCKWDWSETVYEFRKAVVYRK